MSKERPAAEAPPEPGDPGPLPQRVFAAADLFDGEKEIIIAHGDARYRLRITRSGKLIMTK